MKTRALFSFLGLALLLGLLLPRAAQAQGSIPFTIANNSPFADSDLYVAIVGLDNTGRHVWVNARNSAVIPMDRSYNTVLGPTYNGATGPGLNSRYADCFTKLSDVPNKTFTLPLIAGCRVFIARGQQLYFYFYGATGSPSGYSSPNPQNPDDPSRGILYEIIELTNNQFGFFGNPTRVDSYKYPMGLELFGAGYQKRVGELRTPAEIVAAYKANVPAEFQSLVNDATGEITFPSKTPAFGDGTNGTTVGPQANYFKSYIDAIWAKYRNEDLIFNAGDAGVFRGRISGERLTLVGQSGAYNGRTGIIERRPTTQEAFEGKGVLDRRLGDGDADLVVQAQLTAAINRHMVNTTTPNPGQQNWYDVSRFYQTGPANYYARFWHLPGISVDQLSYGFAYDDVADQSASLHTPRPTRVIATFGGYAGTTPPTANAQLIPGKIEAESFSAQSGTLTEPTTDAGGGINVDYFETNDYLDYRVNVQTAGSYTVDFRVASANGGATLQLRNSGGAVLGSVNVGNTGGWQNWITVRTTVSLPAGSQTLRLFAAASTGCNVNWLSFANAGAPAFSRFIEAESFNLNNGMQVEACSEGGQNMGYVDNGDYLVFNAVNFPTSGSYLLEYRVASGAGGGTISADLNGGAIQLGNTAIPGTGGWQNWTTVSRTVNVNAGTYNFGVYAQAGGWNLNWVRITKTGSNRTALASAGPSTRDDARLTLYPNPVTDQLRLATAPELAGSTYRLVNAVGQAMGTGTLGNTLDVSRLPAGLYMLVVSTKDRQTLSRRFTKQ